ncbi:MAG: response regulator transcription factor [Chitinophagaceae bacterium]|nr:response regulator transcription factor [Chitinophagaceae bacterium]
MKYIHGKSLIRIAIAEDHILIRQALSQTINTWENCKVIIQASNGNELLEFLNTEELPDLAIIDLSMPVLNGFDTIMYIKNIKPDIKTCALSFCNSQEVINRLIGIGANEFVDKSEDLAVLKTAINEIMKSGYYYTDRSALKLLMLLNRDKNTVMKIKFSPEEYSFLKLIATDKTYKEIAHEMHTNERHVDYLRNHFFEFYEVKSRTGLTVKIIEKGLTIYYPRANALKL